MARSHRGYKPIPTYDYDYPVDEKHAKLPPAEYLQARSNWTPRPRRQPISTQTIHLVLLMSGLCLMLLSFTFNNLRLQQSKAAAGQCNSTASVHPKLPSHYILPSGDAIPAVALGTAPSGAAKGAIGEAVKVALKVGYRHIDGAWAYKNEEEVGEAIKESGVPREDIWITSKLWNAFHAPEDVEPALDNTLKKLGTDYLDLFLIHWPVAFKKETGPDGEYVLDHELTENVYPTWKAMEALVLKGKVKNIGVSNFNINRIKNLTASPLRVKPAVNQVELSFWNPQPELVKWSKENGLILEAYSPFGSTKQVKESLQVPEVKEIASALNITPAQVLISWAVQRGTIVLPKSITPSRVEENFHVTALPQDLFDKLEAAAANHPPQRVINPSKEWNLGYDIFEWEN